MAIIIDGKEIARKQREIAAARTAVLKENGIKPCLAVILAGNDPASISYVAAKEKALAEAGMESRDIRLPADIAEDKLAEIIYGLNNDVSVHGILVQLPLPKHIQEDNIISAIDPAKDADGFTPVSAGNLVLGRPCFIPCTPHGILVLLNEMNIATDGAHIAVIGRSNIVGKPLANLLIRKEINATVTIIHSGTPDPGYYTRQADILISAAGKAGLVTEDMVKEGAAVIDIGISRIPDTGKAQGFSLKGDVDFTGVVKKASFITPVPGGVGPMTVAMLLLNVVQAAEQALQTGV